MKWPIDLKAAVEEFESSIIKDVMKTHKTVGAAAEALGIPRTTLTEKRRKYGLPIKLIIKKKPLKQKPKYPDNNE